MSQANLNPNFRALVRDGEIAPRTNPQAVIQPQPRRRVLTDQSRAGPKANIYRQVIDLSIARVLSNPLTLNLRGNLLTVNFSTFATDVAQLRFNGSGDYLTVGPGWQFYGGYFDLVELVNIAQAGSSMELVYALDPDSRVFFRYR